MSDYKSDVTTRNRRWLPSEPNRHPLSPTIPVAKLRLYRELAAGASRSLTDLPHSYHSNSSSHRTINRPPSVLSSSSIPTPAPMDRVTLSYPGTPTKSNGYAHQQHYLQQHLSGSATGVGYGRPSSINLHHPSNQYSPDPYVQGTWSLGSHRQSAYQDRYYPSGTNYPSSYNPNLATGSYQNQRDLLTISPSAYARRNVSIPIHSSSASATSAALAARSSGLPGSGGYYRQHHHSDHDLRYINPNSSYPSVPGYGSGSYVQNPTIHRSSGYHPTQATSNSSHYYQQYPHHSRSRHYRSESDLDALSNLYPYPTDPVRTQSGVHSSTHGYHSGTMGPSTHQAYPSSSYYGQHHDPYQQSLEHSRYAQSNPYTIYPGYGQSTGTINATSSTASATNRYNRSLDRYY
ncbi:uncharacterized protein LOC107359915 [Tetranychus urticae]|uniref:Uncharacterized protein n=1 Tax=Tetranychus urticae TaxID=32264 RepID=T1K3Q0_TETUR|nr:uncharacterized protein LOC107359915 [Tetranychus urticae]XP_025016112.1 uncharacterized protein LOC107359915 [Tetranychus urticae]